MLASTGAAVFDETRFATPTEIRSFQKELESRRARASSNTGTATSTTAVAAARPPWMMPAAIAGAAALVLIAALALHRPAQAPERTPALSAAASATPAPAPPPKIPDVTNAVLARTAVQVGSDPPGAAILVDGRDTKQITPATIALRGGGVHHLQLSKRGFVTRDVRLGDADVRAGAVSYTLEAAQAAGVAVSISSTYPVEVFDAARSLSPAAESHQLTVANGTTLHIRAPQYMLDVSVKADGKIDYQAPGVGYLTVLTRYETCNVKVGSKDLGYPPITKLPVASGQYRIDVACPDGQNPPGQFVTVAPNNTATARIY